MKRICTVQDISGVGKCSLSAAMPVLTFWGHEVCTLPTAYFSNHTAFDEVFSVDLTEAMVSSLKVWENQHIYFDCIYTGYIKNSDQLKIVSDFIDCQKKHGAFVVVDPVFADNGKLYSGFDDTFPKKMLDLCKKANVILPNKTEAMFLAGEKLQNDEELIKKLSELGDFNVVLKGLSCSEDRTGIAVFDRETEKIRTFFHNKYSENFFGTGDLFAAWVTGSLMAGKDLFESSSTAASFVEEVIGTTLKNENHRWYGTDFETVLAAKLGLFTK